jgi:hypothetical protein
MVQSFSNVGQLSVVINTVILQFLRYFYIAALIFFMCTVYPCFEIIELSSNI